MRTTLACIGTALAVSVTLLSIDTEGDKGPQIDVEGLPARAMKLLNISAYDRNDSPPTTKNFFSETQEGYVQASFVDELNESAIDQKVGFIDLKITVACRVGYHCDIEDFGKALSAIGGTRSDGGGTVEKAIRTAVDGQEQTEAYLAAKSEDSTAPPKIEIITTSK